MTAEMRGWASFKKTEEYQVINRYRFSRHPDGRITTIRESR